MTPSQREARRQGELLSQWVERELAREGDIDAKLAAMSPEEQELLIARVLFSFGLVGRSPNFVALKGGKE